MEAFIHDYLDIYGPLAVFFLLMLSGFGIALGEEMVTIPAGIFIAAGDVDFIPTALAAYIGIVGADCMWFGLCRRYGMRLLHKRWMRRCIHPRRLLEVKHQFERRGVWLVVMSRFIPSSRTSVITVAGTLDLPFSQFLLATASCVAITVPMQLGLGYLIGLGIGTEDMAGMLLKTLGVMMLMVAIAFIVGWWMNHRRPGGRLPRAPVAWLRRFRKAGWRQPKASRRSEPEAQRPEV